MAVEEREEEEEGGGVRVEEAPREAPDAPPGPEPVGREVGWWRRRNLALLGVMKQEM